MKQFLKYTLATIVGLVVVFFIGMLLFMGIVGAMVASSSKTVKTAPNSVYELELKGELVERSEDDPFAGLFARFLGQPDVEAVGLDDVLANIKKAKADDNIRGIYLKGGVLFGGSASIKEIRNALVDFKSSGKFIVAYADVFSQKNYYLASVADKIYLNPLGMIEFQGIAANTRFVKNTLDKLGIEMQVVRVGTYKSAVEPVVQTKMSDANREQMTVFVTSVWNTMLDEITLSRHISKDTLNALADEVMTFQRTERLVQAQLIDSLLYEDGMTEVLKKLTGQDDEKNIHLLTHADMNNTADSEKVQKEKVAVIYAVGGIDMFSGREGIVSEKLVKTIRQVKEDKAVKAVVFRINSGGGSLYGSEQLWHALGELKKEKPFIVSMGDYAASGGYYIACHADTIVAQPNTLTGSIGIFGTFPNTAGLNNKIGFTYDGVKTNKMSDAITTHRPFTPEERLLLQNYINRGYELFVNRCAKGRNMTTDAIKSIAEGRVWTGVDAKRLGLVDQLGGLNDAIRMAAQKAGLEKYNIKSYPKKEDFLTTLIKDFNAFVEARVLQSALSQETYRLLKQIDEAKSMNGAYALMPFTFTMN